MYAARSHPAGATNRPRRATVQFVDSPSGCRAFRFLHERLHGGAFEQKEQNMKPISKADLYKKSDRDLAGLKEAFRKSVANCEQQRRKEYAALEDIRKVQGQRRRTVRLNL
jgi:hypothetical protein